MSTVTYEIPNDVRGELNLPGVGAVPYEYAAGTVTADTPQDAYVLEHLVAVGLAKVATPKKTTAAAKAAPTTDKE